VASHIHLFAVPLIFHQHNSKERGQDHTTLLRWLVTCYCAAHGDSVLITKGEGQFPEQRDRPGPWALAGTAEGARRSNGVQGVPVVYLVVQQIFIADVAVSDVVLETPHLILASSSKCDCRAGTSQVTRMPLVMTCRVAVVLCSINPNAG
jgi:hypothetical protein